MFLDYGAMKLAILLILLKLGKPDSFPSSSQSTAQGNHITYIMYKARKN